MPPRTTRANRIDESSGLINPRRKQQRYCFARHPSVRVLLAESGLSRASAAIYGDTYDLCGTYCFENRLGSVCVRADLMAHLTTLMPRNRAYRHLVKLEDIGLLTLTDETVFIEWYAEANPTRGEAARRQEARRSQWSAAQRRRRQRQRATRATSCCHNPLKPLPLSTPVNTQYKSSQSLAARLGRREMQAPPGYFYNKQGHKKVLLTDKEVALALEQTERELYGELISFPSSKASAWR